MEKFTAKQKKTTKETKLDRVCLKDIVIWNMRISNSDSYNDNDSVISSSFIRLLFCGVVCVAANYKTMNWLNI